MEENRECFTQFTFEIIEANGEQHEKVVIFKTAADMNFQNLKMQLFVSKGHSLFIEDNDQSLPIRRDKDMDLLKNHSKLRIVRKEGSKIIKRVNTLRKVAQEKKKKIEELQLESKEQEESNEQFQIKIKILQSVEVKPSSGKPFTAYILGYKSESGKQESVIRRYREIHAFHEELKKVLPFSAIPSIPPKRAIGNLKSEFIERRKSDLQLYFDLILELAEVQNSDQLHRFLSSQS